MRVDILLATYNGADYIVEQMDSILSQTFSDFRLLVRDDGSTDSTLELIEGFVKNDDRVFVIKDNFKSMGVGENFKRLLQASDSDYILFSDQDDIWLPNKVETLIQFAEDNFNSDTPSLVYSYGRIVDEELNRTKHITDNKLSISCMKDMLLSNGGVQGCAMLLNKALRNKVLVNDFFWNMHDQVITLYAVVFGNIYYYPKELFLYRQHISNVKGYHKRDLEYLVKKIAKKGIPHIVEKKSYLFFEDFFKFEGHFLNKNDFAVLSRFIKIKDKAKIHKIFFVFRYKVCLSKSFARAFVKVILSKRFVE